MRETRWRIQMIQLFLKNKIAVGLTGVVLAATVGMTAGGVVLSRQAKDRFQTGGYVLNVTEDDNHAAVAERMQFGAGEEICISADGSLLLKDADQNETKTMADSFVHYEDESVASVDGMLLTDLDEFRNGLMDSYYLDQFMALSKTDSGYVIANNAAELQFQNFLLKKPFPLRKGQKREDAGDCFSGIIMKKFI